MDDNALFPGLSTYLRRGGTGLDTAENWTANLPMVPEQRGTLVPGLIPAHVSGTNPRPELAWPGLLYDAYHGINRLLDAGAAERSGQAPAAPSDAYVSQPSPSHTGFGLIPIGETRAPWLTQDDRNAHSSFDASGLAATGGIAMPRPSSSLGMFGGRVAQDIASLGPTQPHSGPVRAYHGTYADFDKFRSGNSLGPHFGTPEHATNILGRGEIEDGARIIPVEINAKKVAETTDHANWVPRSVASELEDLYPDLVGKLKPRLSSQSGVSSYAMRDINSKELREALVENGYDALRYQNEHEGDGGWSYVALKPGTVRSATTGEVLFSNPENAASVPLATQLAHQEHQMPGIIAYHGSPHSFDKFDMSKIGTGEGAQAYGHGLYFADNQDVARMYEGALAKNGYEPEAIARNALLDHGGDVASALDALRKNVPHSGFGDTASDVYAASHADAVSLLDKHAATGEALPLPSTGRMYQVRINADPDHFLDWDKPLSQQNDAAKHALKPVVDIAKLSPFQMPSDPTIHELMQKAGQGRRRAEPAWNNPSAIATHLRDAGIPGIRYFDQGSRAAGEGSRNYVVFDDKLIDILKKYGIVPGAYFGGNALMGDQAQAGGLLP